MILVIVLFKGFAYPLYASGSLKSVYTQSICIHLHPAYYVNLGLYFFIHTNSGGSSYKLLLVLIQMRKAMS